MKLVHIDCIILNVCVLFLILSALLNFVTGHGRLLQPAGRSTAWRLGFPTPINYNDNELFCGGFTTQWQTNGGRCGICGDAYNGVRNNEVPDGKYARSLVITGHYLSGDVITAKVQITANHRGYFVFRLCPATTEHVEVSQECLDKNVLQVEGSPDPTKYILPDQRSRIYDVQLRLPEGLTCERCVLQWTYTAGNNWGKCDGSWVFRVGCGPQETFRACADISIKASDKVDNVNNFELNPSPSMARKTSPKPASQPSWSISRRKWEHEVEEDPRQFRGSPITRRPFRNFWSHHVPTISSSIPRSTTEPSKRNWPRREEPSSNSLEHNEADDGIDDEDEGPRRGYKPAWRPALADPRPRTPNQGSLCRSAGRFMEYPGMDEWCVANCAAGFCPLSHCQCV